MKKPTSVQRTDTHWGILGIILAVFLYQTMDAVASVPPSIFFNLHARQYRKKLKRARAMGPVPSSMKVRVVMDHFLCVRV
jgi:hypothetical protein